MTYRNQKLRDDARGKSCTSCEADDETIVSAHANGNASGKGTGHKGSDALTAWLCYRCHSWLDQGHGPDPTGCYDGSRESKCAMWSAAYCKTMDSRFNKGLVKCV